MLKRTAKLVAAVAIAMLALPAAAGSWPPIPPRKAPAKVAQIRLAQVNASEQAINGFIAEPGENVASLAIIVLVRTLLSFSLEAEIEGRWPWQRSAGEDRQG